MWGEDDNIRELRRKDRYERSDHRPGQGIRGVRAGRRTRRRPADGRPRQQPFAASALRGVRRVHEQRLGRQRAEDRTSRIRRVHPGASAGAERGVPRRTPRDPGRPAEGAQQRLRLRIPPGFGVLVLHRSRPGLRGGRRARARSERRRHAHADAVRGAPRRPLHAGLLQGPALRRVLGGPARGIEGTRGDDRHRDA